MKRDKLISRRVYLLIAFMGLWGTVIGVRLYILSVAHFDFWQAQAGQRQLHTMELTPVRGTIFDRNGRELAISVKVDSIFAVPVEVKDTDRTAKILSRLTGIRASDLKSRLEQEKSFVWIKRKVSESEAAAIESAGLKGVYSQKEDRRFYPKGQLASHVLGYVDIDEKGLGGLEYKYNDRIRGESGTVLISRDARRKNFTSSGEVPPPGANLVTTLDETIQFIVEKELAAAAVRTQAKGIAIVAMDPRSGEILAMASYPTFNPNNYAATAPATWINRAVGQVYEPGSTFKIVTVGAALEEKLASLDERIDCQMGSITLFGHTIHDHEKFGLLSPKEILQHSSDVGAIKLGIRLGEERLASYIARMGFGSQTNVDLPGEERGQVRPTSRWSKISIGAISMGQEISVTPLQILNMVSAVANGGILYRPYVVRKIEGPAHEVLSTTESHGERVISENTARELQDMLEVVVTDGTAKGGRLDGYRAAGKTGTAQKIDETGRYSPTKFVASFAGFAPVSNPVLSLIVVVDEPVGLHQGGSVAAPIFKNIAEQVLRYRSVEPDVPQYAPRYLANPPSPAPAAPKLKIEPSSQWKLTEAAYTTAAGSVGDELGEIVVPDFTGISLRQVAEECSRLGLSLYSDGSGRASWQSLQAGAHVRAGARIRVQFSPRP